MDNLIEKIENNILNEKETLSVMPKNNKKHIDEYLNRIEELRKEYRFYKKEVVKEVKNRYRRIVKKSVKPEVKQLEDELKKYKNLFLLNKDITSYERMGLDVIAYELNHFYKNDLKLINKQIYNAIKIFEKCNIKLTANDFKYNQYTYKYMSVFFDEMEKDLDTSEKLKDVFEEIYFKCSNIMQHINLNIYYIYYKNIKNIKKYFKNETDKFIKMFSIEPEEIQNKYLKLKEEYYVKYHEDESVLLNRFIYRGLDINKYTEAEIKNDYSKIVKLNIDELSSSELKELNDDIYKLSNTLYEYKIFLKYSNIIEDMKKRNEVASKTEYSLEKELKVIGNEENKLMKINAKIEKLSSKKKAASGNNNKVNKLVEDCENQIDVIAKLYEKLEEDIINSKIKKMFANNATIYELLVCVSGHYTYFCNCLTKGKTKEEKDAIDKRLEIELLKEFITNPHVNDLMKNIRVNDNKKIEQIVKGRYYVFNIEIHEEDLKPENLEELLETVNKIVLYNYIKKSSISVKDIKFICELRKMTGR